MSTSYYYNGTTQVRGNYHATVLDAPGLINLQVDVICFDERTGEANYSVSRLLLRADWLASGYRAAVRAVIADADQFV